MTRSLLVAAVFGSAAMTSPAYADVSPAEVWEGLKSYMEGFGYDVEANVSGGGSELVAEDVVMTVAIPETGGSVMINMGDLTFAESGGAVSVSFPENMPISFDVTEAGEKIEGVLDYRHTGLDMLVTGSPQAFDYSYNADEITLALTELVIDGVPVGRDIARAEMTFAGFEGTANVVTGAMREISQTGKVGTISYDMLFTEDGTADTLAQFSGEMTGLSMTATSTLPLELTIDNPTKMFMSDVSMDMDMAFGPGSLTANISDAGETTAIQSSSGGGTAEFDMSGNSMGYGASYRDVAMQLVGGELPFPVALNAAETSLGMTFPIAKSEAAELFAFNLSLGDFELNDMIWNMLDPGKALPRDPATLVVALSGKAKMLFDMMDPTETAAMESEEMPAEVESLSIDEVKLSAVGAEVLGKGAFTFDNSDLTTFDGMPRPEGVLEIDLNGANALMDKLIAMGLLPEDQAMGARMMMSMFAKPVGEDALKSVIEINDQGHVLANGMRIQ